MTNTKTLILGGARSGKSCLAEKLAFEAAPRRIYIATAEALDDEMAQRIARHRTDRDAQWQTVECPHDLSQAIARHSNPETVILVDCLTLWLSNRMLAEATLTQERDQLVQTVASALGPLVLVSNEVGQGIVPKNALARQFRDEAGWLNQAIAGVADNVWFVTAGIPTKLK